MKKFYLNIALLCLFTALLYPQLDWTKHADNPVLSPSGLGSWDETSAIVNTVLFQEDIYKMWYEGDGGIGYATSPDGINWTKDSLNPVIDRGNPGSWDDEEVMHPFVIYENDTLKMYYNGHNRQTQRILYATSIDGRNWNKYPSHPMLSPGFGGAWDSNELGPLAVVHYENLYHMWYTGWNLCSLKNTM